MVREVKESVDVANQLRPVLLRLARELRREIHSLGVTGGQVSLLNAIKKYPGITASALAERERISAPGMSGHLVRLEAAGLIARTRGDDNGATIEAIAAPAAPASAIAAPITSAPASAWAWLGAD